MESGVPGARRALRFALWGVAVSALMGTLAGIACGGDGDADLSRATIGLDGGTVSFEGRVEVEILAGAVGDEITVEIARSTQRPALPEGFSALGDVWEIGPAGLSFDVPARVTLPIPDGEDAEDVLGVVTQEPDSGDWVSVSSIVDAEARTVSAFTTHLSPFSVVGGRSEAARTGGWVRVTNGYVRGSSPFPGARRLPMHMENLVCFTAYAPTNPALLVRPAFNIVVATSYEGWTVGIPPKAVEWWLPAGTYTLEDSIFASEINNDPGYLPARKWWTRPPQDIVITPGAIVEFGPNPAPPPGSSGFVERPNSCAPAGAFTPTPTPTGVATATPGITPSAGEEELFFEVLSVGVAYNGATEPTTFSIDDPWLVTRIWTYHWNEGNGMTPGTVGLQASDGSTFGPWQATGQPGQGGVPNAYWEVTPNVVIPPGTYTVLDSDPDTWSQNEETGGAGMTHIWGIRQ